MTTKIVCLANSLKEGGRCLAGIELVANNNPKIENGLLKWIRPICNTPHGEVPNELVSHLDLLDIIEIELIGNPLSGNYQSENIDFKEDSIKIIGKYDKNLLNLLCDNRRLIFSNRGKAVAKDAIDNLNFSLMFLCTSQFEVIKKVYEDSPGKLKIRLVFSYNEIQYDLPITDPVFLYNYKNNPRLLDGHKELFISLSLGTNWNDWYYKLVTGIIL